MLPAGNNVESGIIKKKRSKTCIVKQKIMKIKDAITVEPLLVFYQMAAYTIKPAMDNLEFEKACRVNMEFNDSICSAILKGKHENYTLQNELIQVAISNMHSWQQPLQSVMPLILGLFLGSFSDRHKWRKPFLLLPILGEIVGIAGCVMCVIYMKQWPLEVQGILQKVVPSFFGGQMMMVMATTAYVADISTLEMRTLRIGIMQILISTTAPLANSFCGILFLKAGYLCVLFTSLVMMMFSIMYGILYVKETPDIKCDKKYILGDMFNPQHALNTFTIIVKKKPGVSRIYIITVLLIVSLHRGAFDGETNLLYLYMQKVFQWTPLEYSYFLTVNGLILLFGNIVGLPLLTTVLHISDLMILFIATVSKIITNIVFGLAKTPMMFYMGVVVSIITRMYRVAKRSLSTKIVSDNDIAKMQSLTGIFEAVAPAISVPIFNIIYIHTLAEHPSAFFFFGIIIYVTCSMLILFVYHRQKYIDKKNSEKCVKVIESVHI